jgi:hypothetical protein
MLLDYCFRFFRNPVRKQQRTKWRMGAAEARDYPLGQPAARTLRLKGSETDFEETVPLVFHDAR